MTMGKALRLAEMTREEVAAAAKEATVVVPTSAIEQHGPHLPMGTDWILGQTIAARAADKAAEKIPVVLAPAMPYGSSHHHLVFGAMSLSSETFMAVLKDLAASLVRVGFKKIFFLNAHGGNDAPIRVVLPDLVFAHDVSVAGCSYWSVAEQAAAMMERDKLGWFPGHAGGYETAAMMAVAGELVREDRLPKDEDHPLPKFYAFGKGLSVQKTGEWGRIDGYTDAPVKATPAIGQELVDRIVEDVAAAIVAFHEGV